MAAARLARRGFPLFATVLIGLTVLWGVAIVHNQQAGMSPASSYRIAQNDHRLAVQAAWTDIGDATTSEVFYAKFGELAAADATMAETLRSAVASPTVSDVGALRASLLESVAIETAISDTRGGPGLSGYLAQLVQARRRQRSLEDSVAATLHIPITH
jgi:hypothetical protein